VANKDERAYIVVLFFSNRRTSNSASSFYLTDSNRRPGLRLQNTRRLIITIAVLRPWSSSSVAKLRIKPRRDVRTKKPEM
jgi:hypothetical protein